MTAVMRPKPTSPVHLVVNNGYRLNKELDLPPTTPPAIAPAWDDFFDPGEGPVEVPEEALDDAPVAVGPAGSIPVDSGASASTYHYAKIPKTVKWTHLYPLPLQ
jgi:hypothetical protein